MGGPAVLSPASVPLAADALERLLTIMDDVRDRAAGPHAGDSRPITSAATPAMRLDSSPRRGSATVSTSAPPGSCSIVAAPAPGTSATAALRRSSQTASSAPRLRFASLTAHPKDAASSHGARAWLRRPPAHASPCSPAFRSPGAATPDAPLARTAALIRPYPRNDRGRQEKLNARIRTKA